jgi:hypothetical protein
MAEYLSLTGEVVFNHISKPDNFKGTSNYKITVALDKDGLKKAEKAGLSLIDYKGVKQIQSKRKEEFGRPLVYNADREEVEHTHLSLFGDKVTINVKKGKEPYDAYTYIEKIRVEEKAEGAGEYDPSEF